MDNDWVPTTPKEIAIREFKMMARRVLDRYEKKLDLEKVMGELKYLLTKYSSPSDFLRGADEQSNSSCLPEAKIYVLSYCHTVEQVDCQAWFQDGTYFTLLEEAEAKANILNASDDCMRDGKIIRTYRVEELFSYNERS